MNVGMKPPKVTNKALNGSTDLQRQIDRIKKSSESADNALSKEIESLRRDIDYLKKELSNGKV